MDSGLESDQKIAVAGTAQSAEEALLTLRSIDCDVAVVDVSLREGMNGIDATREIKVQLPHCKVLILSVHGGRYVTDAIVAGADGYVMKTSGGDTLNRAIHQVYRGDSFIDPNLTRSLFQSVAESSLALEAK